MDEVTNITINEQEPLLHKLVKKTASGTVYALDTEKEHQKAMLLKDIRCKDCIFSMRIKDSAFCEMLLERDAALAGDGLVCIEWGSEECNGVVLPEWVPDNGYCHKAVKKQ